MILFDGVVAIHLSATGGGGAVWGRSPPCQQCGQSSGVRGRPCRQRCGPAGSRPHSGRRQHRRAIARRMSAARITASGHRCAFLIRLLSPPLMESDASASSSHRWLTRALWTGYHLRPPPVAALSPAVDSTTYF
jgi:hypothetical protein